jgi:hypothetical protein
MRIHRRNSLPGPPAGHAETTTDTPARHPRWRPRHRRDRGKAPGSNAGQAPGSEVGGDQAARVQGAPGETMVAPGETMAPAMQLAIALLTAGLDSPEL